MTRSPDSTPATRPARGDANAPSLFEQPATRRLMLIALIVACAALTVADLFITHKGMFGIKQWYGAFALLGFVSCVALGITARAWRLVVAQPQEYYDE